jgi:hypothetical protein
VNGKSIKERIWNDIMLGDDPTRPVAELPKSWRMHSYQYAIPLRLIGKVFSVSVSYDQQNLPGDLACYIPVNPPTRRDTAVITFVAASGHALKPFDARFFLAPSYPTISVFPESYHLLRVKCVRVSAR